MHRIDSDGSIDGAWSNGNPSIGQLGTKLDDDWQNAVQEEICYLIEQLGGTLAKGTNTQLLETMRTLPAIVRPSLTAIWVNEVGVSAIGYRKDACGNVLIMGSAQWNTGASSCLFQLPAGFRPTCSRYCRGIDRSAGMVTIPVVITVEGYVAMGEGTMTNQHVYAFDGIMFVAEQ